MKIRLISLMTLCIIIVQSSILLLFMFNNYTRYSNELNAQADLQIHQIQSRLAFSLPLLLWNYNETAIIESLDSELKNTSLLAIIIKYEGNIEYQVLNKKSIDALELKSNDLLSLPNTSKPVDLTYESRDGTLIVGELYIIDDRRELELKIKNEFQTKLIQIIIIDLVLILLIATLIYQFVLRPLNNTIRGLKNIVQAKNSLSNELPGHYIVEINELSDYYNKLREYVRNMLGELQLKTDNIEAVFNNTKNALLLLNNKGIVQSSNQAVSTLFKTDIKSAIKHNIQDIIKNPLIQNFMQQQFNNDENSLTFELDLCKHKTQFHISVTISKIKQGNDHAYLLVIQDITEQHILYHDLEIALENEQENTKLKSEFLASMSHEIRTPMNGVIGMLELISKTELDSQQIHYNNIAKSSAESLLTIINDILDFSKIEAGKLEIETIEFDIIQLIGEVSQSMAVKAQDKGLDIWLDTSNFNEPSVMGDPNRIRQILTNLINNATKFSESGDILITINPAVINEDQIHFSCTIKDSGIGIDKNKKEKLFESFSQVDSSTTRKFGGTGLGLSIVKNLCELMNGDIHVNSELGNGSEFTFTIELLKSDTKTTNKDIIQKTIPDKICIIEHSKLGMFVLTKLLSKLNNQIKFIKFNEQTTDKLISFLPNIVIIDTSTTGDQTNTLTKFILESIPDLKIIFISNIDQLSNNNYCEQLGIYTQIGKPIILEELLSALSDDHTKHKNKDTNTESQKETAPITSVAPQSPIIKNKVLLVEDNWVNQEIAIALLESFNLEVVVANHGKEALERLKQQTQASNYRIIFMDCQMPEMDGYEATNAIRQGLGNTEHANDADNINSSTLPIIAMTANAMKGDREKCISAGMDDYLSKPINEEELLNKIKKWMH